MTGTAQPGEPAGRHLTPEEVAAAAQGEYLGDADAAAPSHVATCAVCRPQIDDQVLVLQTLAQLAQPPLPEYVAIRIDAALARESAARTAHRTEEPVASARPSAGSSAPRAQRRPARRGFGWATAGLALIAGAVAAAALGGAFSSGSSSASSSSASAGRGVNGPNVAAGGAAGSASPGPTGASGSTWNIASPLSTPEGSVEAAAPASVAAWAQAVLAQNKGVTPLSATAADAASRATFVACAADPAYSGDTAVTGASAVFDGVPAELVVYRDAAAPSTVIAVAYELPCSAHALHLLAVQSFAYTGSS